MLTGEIQDAVAVLERRAMELLAQLGREPSANPKYGIAPKELAEKIIRTLSLPEIATLRPLLVRFFWNGRASEEHVKFAEVVAQPAAPQAKAA